MKNFILATAGHVDHGKTTLIKALTGIDTDRLPEEKARGITIELGFAHFSLGDCHIGVIDVPGHEDFIKNMVAGVGSIDLALLVVAADDGWMPQTEEHLQILEYLGVRRLVVALTKIELAKESVEQAVRSQLSGTSFADAAIVPISAQLNRGIEQLKHQLAGEFAGLQPQRDVGKPRLAIDRAFTMKGIGAVVTGTLTDGWFRRGQIVAIQPGDWRSRIRTIQSHGREIDTIGPATRTALNLADVTPGRDGLKRGAVVTLPELAESATSIGAVLNRSRRLPPKTRPLRHGTLVRIHFGSANCETRVLFGPERELRVGESEIAQLRLRDPMLMFVGDRFVVRDSSEQSTLAGGLVLDVDSPPETLDDLLRARAAAPDDATVFVRTEIGRAKVCLRGTLFLKSRFDYDTITRAIEQLTTNGQIVGMGELLADANFWKELRRKTMCAIDEHHAAYSHERGPHLNRLRQNLSRKLPAETFEALVSALCHDGFARHNDLIYRTNHQPRLPAWLRADGELMRAALRNSAPPSRRELEKISRSALQFLMERGEAVALNDEIVLAADELARMRQCVIEFLRVKGAASVSDLRQALGSSRRIVVPLLEYLDDEGVTFRAGDQRKLKSAASKFR